MKKSLVVFGVLMMLGTSLLKIDALAVHPPNRVSQSFPIFVSGYYMLSLFSRFSNIDGLSSTNFPQ